MHVGLSVHPASIHVEFGDLRRRRSCALHNSTLCVQERGETFLFYSYAHISGGALLIGLCAGGFCWTCCSATGWAEARLLPLLRPPPAAELMGLP